MNWLNSTLRRLAMQSVTFPLSRSVPAEPIDDYLSKVGVHRAGWHAARRRLVLRFTGQGALKLPRIPLGARRVLWLYFGEQQIGDALMDLSPRSLLVDHGIEVDLFSSHQLVGLFGNDPWFTRTSSTVHGLAGRHYDCAIVLSNKYRPLQKKIRHFRELPWVSIHDDFTGRNFHRGLFAAQRLADLMGRSLDAEQLEHHGMQKLGPTGATGLAQAQGVPAGVGLVMGGVHADRTYAHWAEVVRQLCAGGQRDFVLLGAANGADSAASLLASAPPQARITNLVGRLSLSQTRAVMDRLPLVACPDGGLMHVGLTTRTTLVALFTSRISPEWRLPARQLGSVLRSATEQISDIAPAAVAAQVARTLRAASP